MSIALDKLIARSKRALFFPLSFRLAMKLEQVTWAEMCEDIGLAVFTLRANQRLFKSDAIVNWFDTYLEAEAAGASLTRDEVGLVTAAGSAPGKAPDPKTMANAVPIAHAIEIAKRLVAETKDEATVFGCLTGGATLLHRLYGGERQARLFARLAHGDVAADDQGIIGAACHSSTALVKSYCEAGVGALLFLEEVPVADFVYLKSFDAVANLAAYYGVPRILVSREAIDGSAAKTALAAGFCGIVAPGAGYGVAVSTPLSLFSGGTDKVAANPMTTESRLLMTEWELPATASPESVIALRESLGK